MRKSPLSSGERRSPDWTPALARVPKLKSEPRDPEPESRGWRPILLRDVRDNPCADGPATFANCEAQALVHGDRSDQLDTQIHVVAGHHHLGALGEHNLAGDVRRPEVELRTIVGEERGVTSALVLRQDVNL